MLMLSELTYKVPYTNYRISKTAIYNKDAVSLPIVDKMVTIKIDNHSIDIEHRWLYHISMYGIEIPGYNLRDILKHVNVVEQLRSYHFKEHTTVYSDTPFYYKDKVGVYSVRYPKYIVYDNGIIIDAKTGSTLPIHRTGRSRILRCWLHDNKDGVSHHVSIDRLVATAYIANDDWYNKRYILHLDGNRDNSSADNLKWVTYPELTTAAKRGV